MVARDVLFATSIGAPAVFSGARPSHLELEPTMRSLPLFISGFTVALLLVATSVKAEDPDDGFVTIFDGKTLDGWHVSSRTGHGSGGRWVVEDGAIVGSQDKPGNGGIIITDRFMEWTDKEKRHPDQGGIALQVHGGGDFTKQFVRYRKIRVRELH